MNSNIQDLKFAGFLFLNRFKKNFNADTIAVFYEELSNHCDTWAVCDSCCITVIGPFLAKDEILAKKTIETWSKAKNMWIRRASLVILLKVIMTQKDFEDLYVFNLAETMLQYPEDYIQKGIGWLLKICSTYKPDVIFEYLEKNKRVFPKLILRYASEKLPKEKRTLLLTK